MLKAGFVAVGVALLLKLMVEALRHGQPASQTSRQEQWK